jgi:hypothetical protein
MDIYNIWADKKGDIDDQQWIDNMNAFLQQLVDEGKMEKFRVMRMKLGFRSMDIPEWHIMMEFKNMNQLDAAHNRVAPLKGELEDKHKSFNQFVDTATIQHALYRDYPDNI